MIFLRICQSRFIPGMNAGVFVSELDNYQPKINKAKADREANTKQLQELRRERAKEATLLGEWKRLRNVIFGNTKKSEV